MAPGANTYKGLAVPLYGSSEIVGNSTTLDMLTLTQRSAASGDFLVMRTAGGGEVAVFSDAGNLQLLGAGAGSAAGGGITLQGNTFIKFSIPLTTRPTTGLDKGDLLLLFHGSVPKIGVCSSSAANTIKLIRLRTKTFGRLTA